MFPHDGTRIGFKYTIRNSTHRNMFETEKKLPMAKEKNLLAKGVH